jgi:hypothetical protein
MGSKVRKRIMSAGPFFQFFSRIQTISSRPLVYLPLFFVLCLSFFVFSNPWYPAAKLHVKGKASSLPARLMIQWTSGHGLNGYEMYRYALQPLPDQESGDSGVDVTLTRTGNRHPAAADSQVVLKRVMVDGEPVAPTPEQLGPAVENEDDLLVFREIQAKITLNLRPRHHLRLEFLAYNYAGEVEVNFAGKVSRHILYSAWDRTKWTRDNVVVVDYWLVQDDGSFAVSMDMPRYPVDAVRISSKQEIFDISARINSEDGAVVDAGEAIPAPDGVVYEMAGADKKLKRYFHPHRFAFQILFALLTTWLFFGTVRYLAGFDGPADIFIRRKRFVFWLMFLFSVGVFSLWHISFWPGIASTDSLKIWRAAHIPGMYLGDHPPLNVIFYQYLMHFWDNMAVVPIVQNLLSSALISWMFFSMYRWGLPVLLLIPFYLLAVLSVPTGLYNAVLWKDVPFALLTVFLGFRLADAYFRKRHDRPQYSRQSWIILFLLALVLTGFRYNGAVYLLAIPAMLFGLGIITVRKKYITILVCFMVITGAFYTASEYLGSSASSYFTTQTKTYMKQVKKKMSLQFLQERWDKYLGIFDINQTAMQWDHVGNCLYGRYDNTLLRRLRWNDVYAYLPLPRAEIQKTMARKAFAVYKKTYQKPWVYLSWNPVYMLYIIAILPFFYRRLPMAAVFSAFILIEIAALVFIDILNWRYYFFAHFASYFVLPLAVTDLTRQKKPTVA